MKATHSNYVWGHDFVYARWPRAGRSGLTVVDTLFRDFRIRAAFSNGRPHRCRSLKAVSVPWVGYLHSMTAGFAIDRVGIMALQGALRTGEEYFFRPEN